MPFVFGDERTGSDQFYSPAIRLLLCERAELLRWDYGNLSAPYWRFYWNETPGAWILFEGRRTLLEPSRGVVIPPNTPFAARLKPPTTHFYLHFLAAPFFNQIAPAVFSFPMDSHLRLLVREIVALLQVSDGSPVRLTIGCHNLACEVFRRIPLEGLVATRLDHRVEAAIKVMGQRLARPIANPELAQQAGMNANAFVRLFKGATGHTPQAYLTTLRIERACVLLHSTKQGIKEIAEATGFCDRYHFSRVFKKTRGMGPAKFRDLMARRS